MSKTGTSLRAPLTALWLWIGLAIGPATILVATLWAPPASAAPGDVLASIPAPCSAPRDLAWDGTHLWVLGEKTPGDEGGSAEASRLFRVNPSDGSVDREIVLEVGRPRGIAMLAGHLWVSDEVGHVLSRLDLSRGSADHSVPAPRESGSAALPGLGGLSSDGNSLWIGTIAGWSSRIQQVDPGTGEIRRRHFSSGYPLAVEAAASRIWTATTTLRDRAGRIFEYDFASGSERSTFPAPGTQPSGLAFDGESLWCADSEQGRIFRLALE